MDCKLSSKVIETMTANIGCIFATLSVLISSIQFEAPLMDT